MALPEQFLDDIRARVSVSGLLGGSIVLKKAGNEFKACCPFHSEKSPSFTVNDDKGFYHCFGCGAHGDVFRWLTDHQGLAFMDAVRELASRAGLEMPAPSPEQAQRAAKVETVRGALDAAQAIYARQLVQAGAVMEYLAGRGVQPDAISEFGIGYARGRDGSLKGCGIGAKLLGAAGLLASRDDGTLREVFHDRITVPVHDARGRLCGFAGRVWPGRHGAKDGEGESSGPKFINSPAGPLFDKGGLLFNLHRAAPLARIGAQNRLIVVEGHFDVVAMHGAGFPAVAPMGTALTERQLERLWRVHHRPVLMFDGDSAGRGAAVRAAKMAMHHLGPGRALAVALLPEGKDPDDLLRSSDGNTIISAAIAGAQTLDDFLLDAVLRGEA